MEEEVWGEYPRVFIDGAKKHYAGAHHKEGSWGYDLSCLRNTDSLRCDVRLFI